MEKEKRKFDFLKFIIGVDIALFLYLIYKVLHLLYF
jgi:hypothetical protein